VGCPDRRIDRLCITCCSPSQSSHHTGCRMRSRSRRERGRFRVAFTPGHDRPRHLFHSELFYTDIEKRQARSHRHRVPSVPPIASRVRACMSVRTKDPSCARRTAGVFFMPTAACEQTKKPQPFGQGYRLAANYFVIHRRRVLWRQLSQPHAGWGRKWRRRAIHSATLGDCNTRLGFTLPRKLKERRTQEASSTICA
jgi:hypothetical protein